MAARMSIPTIHRRAILNSDSCTEMYDYLSKNIEWYDGIKSKTGPTRKACHYEFGTDDVIDGFMMHAFEKLMIENITIAGIYFNYYRDGDDWTPNHKHETKQIIISLGSPRTLMVGKKEYRLKNGDIIEFGKSAHGVPKEPGTKGRISIAFFTF